MLSALRQTDFQFPGQTGFYRGKVRDVYFFGQRMALVATDRISAFDVVLPRAIPYKGQVLSQVAAQALRDTADIVPNWLEAVPHPLVSTGRRCQAWPVEMVVRGYLAGHAWREYQAGRRVICGVTMPDGLRENDPFPQPLITPTTKAQQGHDMDISREEIIRQGIVPAAVYEQLEAFALALFRQGSQIARTRGLILVDTKYEFGAFEGQNYLIDEVHTPDSSRYFYAEGYDERQAYGQPQRQLSKEFVRQWLIANGFQGKEGQQVPEMSDQWVQEISARYIELYEQMTGQTFVPISYDTVEQDISIALQKVLG